jgi:large subunit ribosomal protein L4
MAKINLLDLNGKVLSTVEVTMPISKVAEQSVFDQIIAETNSTRQGTHSTLTKSEVSGGGKKPRPQKHSGRSRQGSTRAPQ